MTKIASLSLSGCPFSVHALWCWFLLAAAERNLQLTIHYPQECSCQTGFSFSSPMTQYIKRSRLWHPMDPSLLFNSRPTPIPASCCIRYSWTFLTQEPGGYPGTGKHTILENRQYRGFVLDIVLDINFFGDIYITLTSLMSALFNKELFIIHTVILMCHFILELSKQKRCTAPRFVSCSK